MGKKSASPPPQPDPAKTAAAQAAANKESAIAQANINMVNQETPWGQLTFSERGKASDGTPQYTATTTLSPAQQRLLELTNQAQAKYGETANTQLDSVRSLLESPLDFSALGPAPEINEQTRDEVAASMIARNQPQFDRRYDMIQTRLANAGVTDPESEAYKAHMDEYFRSLNDFELAADTSALGQASQLYGLEANARDRAINEMIQERAIPLNELAAMMTGAQVQGPSFVNTPQQTINPADIMGATYGSANLANQAYQAQLQRDAAETQGLYSLLGTGLTAGAYMMGGPAAAAGGGFAFSDRRLKTDVHRIATRADGLGVYVFRYLWSPAAVIGFMADEVRAIYPRAVATVRGFDAVNYAEVT